MLEHTVNAVAIAHTPFKDKFGIPRQSGLVDVPAVIELLAPYNQIDAVEGLQQVSHIWLTFLFNQHLDSKVQIKVRPPRLGGNKKVGVFATRSSFRPNAIGQSVVRLLSIEHKHNTLKLHVQGIDVVDGTPIIDIKPYVPYVDAVVGAVNLLAPAPPILQAVEVIWQANCLAELQEIKGISSAEIHRWITELIQLDPRPAYKTLEKKHQFAMSVFQLNVQWCMLNENLAEVFSLQLID